MKLSNEMEQTINKDRLANLGGIFDYFGDNYRLIEANEDRHFTDREKVAIIVNSDIIPLDRKIADMRAIATTCEKELADVIKAWIDGERLKRDFAFALKGDGVVFVQCMCGKVQRKRVYRTLEDALADSLGICAVAIEDINSTEQYKRCGSVRLNRKGEITSISLMGFDELPKVASEVYDYTFRPTLPFKPYEMLLLHTTDRQAVVLADADSKGIHENVALTDKYNTGWIELDIPVVDYKDDGEGLFRFTIKRAFGAISDLRACDKCYMTLAKEEYRQSLQEAATSLNA